jgi:N-acetylneuraminic acid mutarotase
LGEARSWFGAASVAGKIYAIGGMTGEEGDRRATNEVFDPRTNKWTLLAPMPRARASLAVVAVGNMLYAIGGYFQHSTSNHLEAFDTTTGKWDASLPPMPTPRFDLSANVIGNTIYVLGGFDNEAMNVVEQYDTITRQWRALPPMQTARYALASIVLDGKLYAFGGRNRTGALDTIEVFDPQTQTWSWLNTKIPEPVAGFGIVRADDSVHVLKYDLHFAYHIPTNTWRTDLPAMPTSRHGLKADYIDGVIYAVGGCATGDGNLFDVERNEAYIIHAPAYLDVKSKNVDAEILVALGVLIAVALVGIARKRSQMTKEE